MCRLRLINRTDYMFYMGASLISLGPNKTMCQWHGIAQYRSYDTWKRHGELQVGVVRGKETGHLILSDDLGISASTAASRHTPILQQALTQSGRYWLRDCPMTALWWRGRDGSCLKSGPRPAFGANPAYQIFCAAPVNSCQHLHYT